MAIEFTKDDFESPEAIATATALQMAEHLNIMSRISRLSIDSVYNLGRLNVEHLREFLVKDES